MTTLTELADRCEAAAGPDRELDALICAATQNTVFEVQPDGHSAFLTPSGPSWVNIHLRAYTASIDAAMTLRPEGWLLHELFERNATGVQNWRWKVELWRPETDLIVKGIARKAHNSTAAPALALCAAALRARVIPA